VTDNNTSKVASFMLRFVQESGKAENEQAMLRWRGSVNHVQNGTSRQFSRVSDALTFIQDNLSDINQSSLERMQSMTKENLYQENLALWQQFSTGYSDMAKNLVDNSLKQGEEIGKSFENMNKSLLDNWMPGKKPESNENEQSNLIGRITELESQVVSLQQQLAKQNVAQDLAKRLDKLEASMKETKKRPAKPTAKTTAKPSTKKAATDSAK
jgi:Mg2+ and Co2+ transporter CorA